MANVFRPPIIVRIPRRPNKPSDDPLRLQTLFAPNPTRPFRQDDWPNAVRALAPQKSDAPANNFPLIRPNPPRPFTQSDWQPVKKYSLPLKSDEAANEFALLRPNPTRPFTQSDWANATRAARKAFDDYVPNRPTAPAAVQAPFNQSDWEPLNKPLPALKSDEPSNEFPLLRPNPSQPFSQFDWQLAKRYGAALNSDAPENLLPFRALPFSQVEWALPSQLRKPVGSDVAPENLLPFGTLPFSQTEWVLPYRAKRPVGSESYVLNSRLPLLSQFPFAGADLSLSYRRLNTVADFHPPNLLLSVLVAAVDEETRAQGYSYRRNLFRSRRGSRR